MTDPELQAFPEDWDRALAVVAHPDDLEYGAASAIARWTDQGRWVGYVLATRGEAGIDAMEPTGAGPLREAEEVASAAVVGVDTVEFLGLADGMLEPGLGLRRLLAGAIRRHRPELLLSINFRLSWGGPSVNMADHRVVGEALLDAARDAGNRHVFAELGAEGLEPWAGVRRVAFSGSPQPTHAVDVTATFARGLASLAEHRAYLAGLGDGTTTPEDVLLGPAEATGALIGTRYGASFEVFEL